MILLVSIPLRPAIALTLLGLVAAIVLAGLARLTEAPIREAREQRALSTLMSVLPAERFDNDLAGDWIDFPIDNLDPDARLYRAWQNDQPSAVIIDLTTARGYSGDIRLLVALTQAGEVLSVRALEHRETPGLGDRIETRHSDWIEQFAGRSLGDPPRADWMPDRQGGAFDTLTSATITSSAVIEAIERALTTYRQAQVQIWDRPESDDRLSLTPTESTTVRP